MSIVVVKNQEYFATRHAKVKNLQPFCKDDLGHPDLWVILVLAAEIVAVDVLETAWVLIFSDNPERELVCTIAITTDNPSDNLLVLFPSLQLLGSQGVVCLLKGYQC